ncbi:hypothetical protein PMZ80_008240 [Knufia obscura]|uniref:Uncharacterized protein n=2 Tax=Knufia TaxID=430999 RepID=A0AAN8I884_9EURO|nr:hypothetical protein PMZ80_008240 [Knufia obscura]KAK5957034.1 hypothetical protein OHC33_001403 [Knufia fluminis]
MLSLSSVLGTLFALSAVVFAQDAGQSTTKSYPKSITLSYELLGSSASAASPFAIVKYDPRSLDYTLTSWTPPSLESLQSTSQEPTSAPLLRVLLPNGSASVASLGTFDPKLSQNIDIWISQDSGEVVSASVGSITPPPLSEEEERLRQKEERLRKRGKAVPSSKPQPKPKSKKAKDAVVGETTAGPVVRVNLLVSGQGLAPKLNSRKPPQVDSEGREVVAEEQQEKTFLQKYWYILLALAFVLMSGGGGK